MSVVQRWVCVHRNYVGVLSPRTAGYTITELLAALLLAAALGAIASLGWVQLLTRLNLDHANDRALQQIRLAQTKAKEARIVWQVSFRSHGGTLQAALHLPTVPPEQIPWQTLAGNVEIDPARTTLLQRDGMYRLQFSQLGRVNGQLGRLTLKSVNGNPQRRCVVTSTLLGTMRKVANERCPLRSGHS